MAFPEAQAMRRMSLQSDAHGQRGRSPRSAARLHSGTHSEITIHINVTNAGNATPSEAAKPAEPEKPEGDAEKGPTSLGPLPTWDNLDDFIALAFMVPCVVCFFQMLGDGRIRERLEQKATEQERLEKSTAEMISEMDSSLTEMAESSAILAESNFEAKRRDFHKFLRAVQERPAWVGISGDGQDAELVANFRRFVQHWLLVFRECSKDPVVQPKLVVTAEELDGCSTIEQVVGLLLRPKYGRQAGPLEESRVELITSISETKRVQEDLTKQQDHRRSSHARDSQFSFRGRSQRGCCCCSWLIFPACLGCGFRAGKMHAHRGKAPRSTSSWPVHVLFGLGRFTLLSYKHAMLLNACALGVVLAAHEATAGKWAHALVHGFAALLLLTVLIRFEHVDKLALLEIKVQQLEDQNGAVEKHHTHINDIYHKSRMFADLWQYRTVPRLDILKEMHEMLRDTPPKYIRILLDGLVNELDKIEDCVGPLGLWYGKGALQEEKLKFVGKQLSMCADRSQKEHSGDHSAIAKILLQATPFCLVTIHKFAAYNLVNKDSGILGDLSDPYVRGRIGKGPHIQTLILSDDLNPSWPHEEFVFLATPEDSLLELQLLDCDSFTKDDSLGGTELNFREAEPGVWHTVRRRLRGVAHGELEFEILCATAAEHLSLVRSTHFSHAAQTELSKSRAIVCRDLPRAESATSSSSEAEDSDRLSVETEEGRHLIARLSGPQ